LAEALLFPSDLTLLLVEWRPEFEFSPFFSVSGVGVFAAAATILPIDFRLPFSPAMASLVPPSSPVKSFDSPVCFFSLRHAG